MQLQRQHFIELLYGAIIDYHSFILMIQRLPTAVIAQTVDL